MLIVCSTVVDPDRAPAGQGVSKLLTFAPREVDKDRFADQIVARTAERVPGLRPGHVLAMRGEAPADLRRATGTTSAAPATAGSSGCRRGRCWWAGRRTGSPSRGSTRPAPPPTPAVRSPGGPAGTPHAYVLTDLGIDPATVMGAGG